MIRNKCLVFCRPNVLVPGCFINICQGATEVRCLLTVGFSFVSARGRLPTLTIFVNSFVPNEPFLYPLKTSENRKVFFMLSGGRERVHWERMG